MADPLTRAPLDTMRLAIDKQMDGGFALAARFSVPTERGAVTVLFGPSGAGKTTVLRCIAGLERPDSGTIHWRDEVWFEGATGRFVPARSRGIGVVFQDEALFAHLDVRANVTFGLRYHRPAHAAGEPGARVEGLLARFQLDGLADRRPGQLSGGQRRRVALARALAPMPRLLLLDEPFAGLDTPARAELLADLGALIREAALPVVLITHDRHEAAALGERMVVIIGGAVRREGLLVDVLARPGDADVARAVGVETIVAGRVVERSAGLLTISIGLTHLLAVAPSALTSDRVLLAIRAEDVVLERAPAGVLSSARNRLVGRIKAVVPEGPLMRVRVDCGFALDALVTRQAIEALGLTEGVAVIAAIKTPAIHVIGRSEGAGSAREGA